MASVEEVRGAGSAGRLICQARAVPRPLELLRTAYGDLAGLLHADAVEEGWTPTGCRGLDAGRPRASTCSATPGGRWSRCNTPAPGPADHDAVDVLARPGARRARGRRGAVAHPDRRPALHGGLAGDRRRLRRDAARRCSSRPSACDRGRAGRHAGPRPDRRRPALHAHRRGRRPPPRPRRAPRPSRTGARRRWPRSAGCWRVCSARPLPARWDDVDRGPPRHRPGTAQRRRPAELGDAAERVPAVRLTGSAPPGTLGPCPSTPSPHATDVLVVGAGPAGSAAAAWAARAGPRRRPRRRRRLPAGQDLRRRADARAPSPSWTCSGLGRLGARHGPQPRPARGRVRPGVAAALARRRRSPTTAARCRAPSSTPASAQVRAGRRAPRRWTAPGRSTSSGTATGSPASCSSSPTRAGRPSRCRAAGRRRRRALAAGPGARPRVAPRHRLRGRRPRLRALRPQRRRVDLLAPGAARRRRRAAVRLRLGLPARRGRRRGQHRRRHAGHRPPSGRGAAQAAAGVLRRRPPRRVAARRRRCARPPRRCCRWAARSPAWPGATGR